MLLNTGRVSVLQLGKFYPPHCGGMETHLKLLCDGLSRLCDVSVIVANDTRWTISGCVDNVSVTRIGAVAHLAGTAISPAMIQAIRNHPADIVHVHWPNPTALAAFLASGHRGRLVITYHSDVVRQSVLAHIIRPLVMAGLNRADSIIVTSKQYAETSRIVRGAIGKCRVIPFGLDTEPYDDVDQAKVRRIRARYGSRLLVAVGRHVYYKGFEYLIAAMQNVRGKVLLVGDGPLRRRLEGLAVRLGVNDRVVFVGEVDDVIPYYYAADAVVLPSTTRSEAFGIVQIEAMACARPVINTSLDSSVPLVSVNGKTGLTVAPGNAEALASAMNLLLQDESLRNQYGRAARDRVETEFKAGTMIRRTFDVYGEILRGAEMEHVTSDLTACV